MDLYIKGTGIISGAGNNKADGFPGTAQKEAVTKLPAIEPDYTGEIPPMQLRRMGKAVRIGLTAARICLNQSGVEKPDAISVGSAMGCLEDTDNFLQKMVAQDEQMLTPTSFIQSTHNTVAGSIALLTGCNGHNLTYVQRGHSFEHALINAQLYLDDNPGEKIMVGGIDELTNTSHAVLQSAKIYNTNAVVPSNILSGSSQGTIAGEGAAFFMAAGSPFPGVNLHVKDISVAVTKDILIALRRVDDFLLRNEISTDDIDLVMLGISGDERTAIFYKRLQQVIFKSNSQAGFKHLCGEYGTATAFALGILMQAATEGKLPESVVINHQPKQLKNILIINNYVHYYSFWYITVHQ